ncbi:hypothetical protein KZX45_18205 [Georgenia sp. EYE_87]|uniref:hypothetical protein n=1 Tax=Georgenia sp. EYE_87 TaxID=2853448 RepID=UPI002006C904|nr:hypothetical protein [Georgenia sp. EYE_87]MCK6212479.1 hypothetical protein [Georgenia sp. EYE_87]
MTEQHPARAGEHPGQDVLVDLALGEVVEPGRSALARHLAACESCREGYATLAAGLEHVLAAAPTVAPPPGFESRALAAMVPARRAAAPGTTVRARPGAAHRRRTALVAAAAAVAGLAVGAGGALLVTRDGAEPGPSPTVAEPRGAAELVKADGAVVGSVTASRYAGDAVLVVAVASAPTGVRYACRGVLPDGTEVELGTWTIGPERSATWVVTDPGATGVRLVTDSGRVWADAQL